MYNENLIVALLWIVDKLEINLRISLAFKQKLLHLKKKLRSNIHYTEKICRYFCNAYMQAMIHGILFSCFYMAIAAKKFKPCFKFMFI